MKPGSPYDAVESIPPLKGLVTAYPSNRIDPAYSPALKNVIIRDGVVKRRAGGNQLGRQLVGRVMGITEFGLIGGTPYTVALTSHRQYIYDPTDQDWIDLTPGQTSYTITAVTVLSKLFKIAGDHVTDFPVGRLIPVIDGANEGVYTVVSATLNAGNTDIVVDETVPSAVVAGAIVIADDFDTAVDGWISYVLATDAENHQLLITNGLDAPRSWDGDPSNDFLDWVPEFEDFVTCREFEIFNEHLFMGDITTLGGREPSLIAWSDAGDFDEFEAGAAGAQLLYQLSEIVSLRVLGDRLGVYSHDAIVTGINVGPPAIFAFETVIPQGTRYASSKGITSINVGHLYVAEENFYLFDGTRGLRVLTDAVWNHYKNSKDQSLIHEVCVLNDYSKRTLYFAFPDLEGRTSVLTVFYDAFDLGNLVWSSERYLDKVSCWGFFVNRDEELFWEDASWETPNTKWEDELGLWAEEGEQLNFPIRAYGTPEGRVLIATEGAISDRGTVPLQSYSTKDFSMPNVGESIFTRWGEIEFEAWGTQVNVLVSLDKGHTNKGVETVALTSTPEWYRLPIDYNSRTIRGVFVSSGNEYSIRSVRFWGTPGGPE